MKKRKVGVGAIVPFFFPVNSGQALIALNNTVDILYSFVDAVIVINDGAPFDLTSLGCCQIITHSTNLGKAEAVRSGLKEVLKDEEIQIIVQCDYDKDQNPQDDVSLILWV